MWEYPALRLQSIVRQAGPSHATTFVVRGQGFETGSQLFLLRAGGSILEPRDVVGGNDVRVASQTQMSFVANLDGKAGGWYDAVLILPSRDTSDWSERSAMLAHAHEVREATASTWPEDVLQEIRPELGPDLVPDETWARIVHAAQAGPALRHGDLSLECHLRSDVPRVDLILRLLPEDRDFTLLRAENTPGLDHTLAFLRRWADPESGFSHVPWVDLESDLESDTVHEPFLSPGIEAYYDHSALQMQHLRTQSSAALPVADITVARAVLRAFDGPELSAGVLTHLEHLFARLPADGFVIGTTSLQCRWASPSDAVRAVVSLPTAHAPAYLNDLGAPLPKAVMDALLVDAEARVTLDLDVEDGRLGPRVARYYTFASPHPECGRLAAALELLRTRGLARGERLEALVDWIRQPRTPDARARRVLTLKVIARGSGLCEAKAYLTFGMPPARAARIPGLARVG